MNNTHIISFAGDIQEVTESIEEFLTDPKNTNCQIISTNFQSTSELTCAFIIYKSI